MTYITATVTFKLATQLPFTTDIIVLLLWHEIKYATCMQNLCYNSACTSQFTYLCWRLLVILGFKQLFTTHCTYCFLVSTSLTIMGPHLMHILSTDAASLKFWCVRTKSEFVSSNGFIFTNLATTTFNSISCSWLPWIRCNDASEFLLTLLTNHFGSFKYNKLKTNKTCA